PFIFPARDAILRPDLPRHTAAVMTLLTQQVSCDAGVPSTAHPEQNTLFLSTHSNVECPPHAVRVNEVDRLLLKAMEKGHPKALNNSGSQAARQRVEDNAFRLQLCCSAHE